VSYRFITHLASIALALAVLTPAAPAADAPDPPADAKAFRNYFVTKFPNVKLEDFVNGPYSMNEDMRRQWEEKEQFPP
jgi:sulfur-oxidizing protein SoxA